MPPNAGLAHYRRALEVELEAEFAKRTREDVLSAMVKFGVLGGPINSIDQVFADPHVIAREMQQSFTTSQGTPVSLTRFPVELSKTPAKISSLPPVLGADSRKVLQSILNLTDSEITQLTDEEVIGTPE